MIVRCVDRLIKAAVRTRHGDVGHLFRKHDTRLFVLGKFVRRMITLDCFEHDTTTYQEVVGLPLLLCRITRDMKINAQYP